MYSDTPPQYIMLHCMMLPYVALNYITLQKIDISFMSLHYVVRQHIKLYYPVAL